MSFGLVGFLCRTRWAKGVSLSVSEGVAVAERSQVAADGFRAPVPRERNRTYAARVDKILGVVVDLRPAAAAKLVVSPYNSRHRRCPGSHRKVAAHVAEPIAKRIVGRA